MFGMMEGIFSFIRRQVGLRTDAANAAGSLHAKIADVKNRIADVKNRIPTSIIKSIQRGVHPGSTNDITISINTVNPNKCLFIVTPYAIGISRTSGSSGYSGSIYQPYLKSLTATRITTSASYVRPGGTSNDSPNSFSWQLIEFY
jgi:hypothetical protein